MERTEWYIFVLAAILIAAVYYTGVKTDLGAFSSLFVNGINVVTGRNAQGQFQSLGNQ